MALMATAILMTYMCRPSMMHTAEISVIYARVSIIIVIFDRLASFIIIFIIIFLIFIMFKEEIVSECIFF